MDPSDRNIVLAALDTASNPPETLSCLAKYLVADGIFTDDFVGQHSKEILGIWRDWRQPSALSPPDSNLGGRHDDPDANSPTGRLALYAPKGECGYDKACGLCRSLGKLEGIAV